MKNSIKELHIGYVAGNKGTVELAYTKSIAQIFEEVGENLGNLAFWHASQLFFDNSYSFVGWDGKINHINFKKKINLLLFPAANWLNEKSDLSCLAELIRTFNVPCIIFGLGSQSDSENEIPRLKHGTIDFLTEISKRTPLLFLRGEFTKKVCEHYGVTNTVTTGCPTLLINNDRNLGKTIENKFSLPINNVAIQTSIHKESLRKTEQTLVEYIYKNNGSYIVQDPDSLLRLISNQQLTQIDEIYINVYQQFCMPNETLENFKQFICKQGKYYISINSWINDNRRFTHSIGFRIHGTMLSLMATTPSICLCHDTRTNELCKIMQIPFYNNSELPDNYSVEELLRSYSFNGESFEINRSTIAGHYRYVLRELDVKISNHLISF